MPATQQQSTAFFPAPAPIPPAVTVSADPYELRYLIDGEIRA